MTAAIGQSEQRTGFQTPHLYGEGSCAAPHRGGQRHASRLAARRRANSGSEDFGQRVSPRRRAGDQHPRQRAIDQRDEGSSDRHGERSSSCRDLSRIGAHLSAQPGATSKTRLSYVRSKRTTRRRSKRPCSASKASRRIVLQHHFSISTGRVLSPADLRAELAIVALEKAFGNKIKTGLGKGAGLPAKPGRLLAGQLFKQPREIASDGKLIVQLASEIAGAREQSIEALELAVLRRLTTAGNADDGANRAPTRPKRSEPSHHRPPRADPESRQRSRTAHGLRACGSAVACRHLTWRNSVAL